MAASDNKEGYTPIPPPVESNDGDLEKATSPTKKKYGTFKIGKLTRPDAEKGQQTEFGPLTSAFLTFVASILVVGTCTVCGFLIVSAFF